MRTLRLCSLALLAGCSPYLGGSWDGEYECPGPFDPIVLDIELDLTHHGLGDHSGELVYDMELELPDGSGTFAVDATYQVELFAEGTEKQDLGYTFELLDYDCEYLLADGSEDPDGCFADETDEPQEGDTSFKLGTWTWDGGDDIDMEDEEGDCEGALER